MVLAGRGWFGKSKNLIVSTVADDFNKHHG